MASEEGDQAPGDVQFGFEILIKRLNLIKLKKKVTTKIIWSRGENKTETAKTSGTQEIVFQEALNFVVTLEKDGHRTWKEKMSKLIILYRVGRKWESYGHIDLDLSRYIYAKSEPVTFRLSACEDKRATLDVNIKCTKRAPRPSSSTTSALMHNSSPSIENKKENTKISKKRKNTTPSIQDLSSSSPPSSKKRTPEISNKNDKIIQQLEERIQRQQEELDSKETSFNNLTKKLSSAEAMNTVLKSNMESLLESTQKMKGKFKDMEKQNKDLRSNNEHLNTTLSLAQENIQTLEIQIQKDEKEIKNFKNKATKMVASPVLDKISMEDYESGESEDDIDSDEESIASIQGIEDNHHNNEQQQNNNNNFEVTNNENEETTKTTNLLKTTRDHSSQLNSQSTTQINHQNNIEEQKSNILRSSKNEISPIVVVKKHAILEENVNTKNHFEKKLKIDTLNFLTPEMKAFEDGLASVKSGTAVHMEEMLYQAKEFGLEFDNFDFCSSESLKNELEQSDNRSLQISQVVADLNKQLQDSLQTPKPSEGGPKTPKSLETIVQSFKGSNAEKSTNLFFDSTKFLEGEATKKLRIDLQKAYEGNLKLERDKEDHELRIRTLQKTIKDQSKRIKQQQDQFEDLSSDFSRLETDLVQHKIRLVDAEDRCNDFEYQLMRINKGVKI